MKASRVKAKDLATAASVYPATVSAWRNGEYMPEGDRLAIVARVLMVDPTWLTASPESVGESGAEYEVDPVTALVHQAIDSQRQWLTEFAARLTSALQERDALQAKRAAKTSAAATKLIASIIAPAGATAPASKAPKTKPNKAEVDRTELAASVRSGAKRSAAKHGPPRSKAQ